MLNKKINKYFQKFTDLRVLGSQEVKKTAEVAVPWLHWSPKLAIIAPPKSLLAIIRFTSRVGLVVPRRVGRGTRNIVDLPDGVIGSMPDRQSGDPGSNPGWEGKFFFWFPG